MDIQSIINNGFGGTLIWFKKPLKEITGFITRCNEQRENLHVMVAHNQAVMTDSTQKLLLMMQAIQR